MSVTVIARCVHGIEWLCADEIDSLLPPASDLALSRRQLSFTVTTVAPRLLRLRTVDDVFLAVGRVDGVGTTKDVPTWLATRVARLDVAATVDELRAIRRIPRHLRFDVVASLEGRRTYNRFAVENAAGAALAPVLGGSYLERTRDERPPESSDLTVRIFVRASAAEIAVRVGSHPLHRRDYKQDTGPGTLHPPLAAALARLVGEPEPATVLDPFCGDGTIAIEAALAYPDALVIGGDLDPGRLANARRNAHRAGAVTALVRSDVANPPWRPGSVAALVTNPPWNLAVDADGRLKGTIDPLWQRLPDLLTVDGRVCLVTDAGLESPTALRQLGYAVALQARIRLAGRISDLILCAPPGWATPSLPVGAAAWRRRAIRDGVVTQAGF